MFDSNTLNLLNVKLFSEKAVFRLRKF